MSSNLFDCFDTVKVAVVSFVFGANGNPVSFDYLAQIITKLTATTPADVHLIASDCVGYSLPGSLEKIKKAKLTRRSDGAVVHALYIGTLNAPAWVYDVEFW